MNKPEAKGKTPLRWVRSPQGVLDFYANSIHPTWTLDDVRLRLGQTIADPERAEPGLGYGAIIEERVGITLSWRMAKILRDGLIRAIENYEKVNGTIQTDVKIAPSFDTRDEQGRS